MKILLIFPYLEVYKKELFKFGVVPPLGIAYIASVLEKAGHDVQIIDCLALGRTSPMSLDKNGVPFKKYGPPSDYISSVIREFQPELVGISSMMANSEGPVLEIAAMIKEIDEEIKIILGGMNITGRPEYFLAKPNIDFVAVSEGEYLMSDLANALENDFPYEDFDGLGFKRDGKIKVNPKAEFIPNLDDVPFPATHLLNMDDYFHGETPGAYIKYKKFGWMVTSRGCTLNCSFCTTPSAWKAWRGRSPENVVAEMEEYIHKYGVKEIQFIDDNISADPERFERILDLIIERNLNINWWAANGMLVHTLNEKLVEKMAKAGCYAVIFGLESGDPEMQKYIKKTTKINRFKTIVDKCQEVGIWVAANLIIGLPGETMGSARNSIEFAKITNLDALTLIPAIPLPGTKVYEDVKDKLDIDYSKISFYSDHTQTISDFSKEELQFLVKKFFREFLFHSLIHNHLNPRTIFNRLCRIRSFEDILFYWRIVNRFFSAFTLGLNSMKMKNKIKKPVMKRALQ